MSMGGTLLLPHTRYFFRIYDIEGDRPRVARRLGNIYPGDGILFHGRGYVRLTGRSNYAKMQRRFGIHLTSLDKAANRALQSGLAAKIMFYGMEHGVFNGKKFDDYFAKDRDHWVQARSIINPGDKSRLVADYARDYYAAISCTR
jgi:putative chitinase